MTPVLAVDAPAEDVETAPAEDVATPPERRPSFRAALWIGRALLVAQLAWITGFSTLQYRRDSLTYDFAVWNQARWLIVHGHLNPHTTFFASMPFWQINGTWMMWPLAELSRIPPHGLLLLWFQDLTIFGCAWVALHWVAEAAAGTSGRHQKWRLNYQWKSQLSPAFAVGLAALLLVANPWVYTSAAFDFHWEEPAAFFMMLAAWDLSRGRTRRLWIWVALVLSTSDVSALYVVGVGVAGLLACGQAGRRTSTRLIGAGLAWLGLMTLIHANRGSYLSAAYGYLAGPHAVNPTLTQIARGAVTHPSRPISELWGNRVNFWANLSPSGLLGVVTPWGIGALLTVLLPGALWGGHLMAAPSFQNFPAYPLVVVGSILVLGRLGARLAWVRYAARPLALAMAGLAVAWAWVWLPLYPHSWLAVTPGGGAALAKAREIIPADAEVVVSQSVSGRFAERQAIYTPMGFPFTLPLVSHSVYFVLTPNQGISYLPQDTQGMLGQLARLDAHLLLYYDGVWVFRWDPPLGAKTQTFAGAQGGMPGWLLDSNVGAPTTSGPSVTWRMQGDGRPGIVLWGDYWNESAGQYTAFLQLAATGPLTVQVWQPLTGKVLATDTLTATGQDQLVQVPFTLGQPRAVRPGRLPGRGPLRIEPPSGSPGQLVEVRVLNPANTVISVNTVGVRPGG